MQRVCRRVSLPVTEIELRSAERVDVAGIGQLRLHLATCQTGELREKGASPLAHGMRQFATMVGKIEERARRREFLPLEQHRDSWHQQEIGGHRAQPAGARQRVTALASAGIGDLIMVLQKDDKAFRRQIERRCAARFALPLVALPLIKKPVLGGRDELARAAAVIRVVGFVPAGQRDRSAVMEIVVPQRVEPVAAVLSRSQQPRLLRLVLSDDERAAAMRRRSHRGERWRR